MDDKRSVSANDDKKPVSVMEIPFCLPPEDILRRPALTRPNRAQRRHMAAIAKGKGRRPSKG